MFSQNLEAQIIKSYFGDRKIMYLDIGSNDGKTLSNTYDLYINGSIGVCVEPSPKAFMELQETQTHCVLINAAVGIYDGDIILYESGELLGCGDTSLVSTTKESELKRWNNMPFEPIVVRCITFDTLIKECGVDTFDFLSLDIEGMELDILPQIDFNKFGITLACIEFNGKDKYKDDAIMLPQGFHVIHQNAENLIYAK